MLARLFCCRKRHRFDSFRKGAKLDLSNQSLSGEDMPDLIEYLSKRPAITKLDLRANAFTADSLLQFAKNNKYIKELYLGRVIEWDSGWGYEDMNHYPPEAARNRINDEAALALCENEVFTRIELCCDEGVLSPEVFQKIYDIVIRESTEWIKFTCLIKLAKASSSPEIFIPLISEIAGFCGVQNSKRNIDSTLMQTKFFKNETMTPSISENKKITATKNCLLS